MVVYLQAENISKSFGDLTLFENISLSVHANQKIALIAKNGKGKTTLLNIMAGTESPDQGEIILRNGISTGYLPQNPVTDKHTTVLEHVFQSSNELVKTIERYERALHSNNKAELGESIEEMDRLEAWDFEVRIKQILTKLNITEFDQPVEILSGGQKKRLALANVLINEPDLLVLDEPTNHLDLEMIEWLEHFLKKTKSALFMVTHDRYFLDRVCNEILEMDDKVLYQYKGNYNYFLEKRAERIQISNATVERARNLLKREQEWMNRTPSARGTKAKHRIDQYHELKETASHKLVNDQLELDIQTRRLGKKILNLYNISKQYDEKTLFHDFSYKFVKNDKIGILGPNGSGKTTLLDTIEGSKKPDEGKIETGETVVFGYYKQHGIKLKEGKRVIETIRDVAEVITLGSGKKLTAKQFLEYFLFPSEMHYNLVSKLSGGEKRRLYLMTVLMKNPNFLLLDEPTNDLDIMTLNVLEEYLNHFQGCVLIVSHDRFFMDKVADTMFVFGENGKISHFPGNYSAYKTSVQRQQKNLSVPKKEKQEKPKTKVKKKFSYKHKKELEETEKLLSELEEEKANLEQEMNSSELEQKKLVEKSERYHEVLDLISEKEMRWLELSELKEEDI